jgi:hypothetical protein
MYVQVATIQLWLQSHTKFDPQTRVFPGQDTRVYISRFSRGTTRHTFITNRFTWINTLIKLWALLKSFFVNFKPVFKNTYCIYVDGLTALFACVKRLGLAFNFGFKFPVGGSVKLYSFHWTPHLVLLLLLLSL